MTNPPITNPYPGAIIGTPAEQREWEIFMQRRKELFDSMIGASHSAAQQFGMTPPLVQPQQGAGQPGDVSLGAPPTMDQVLGQIGQRPRLASRDELIAQARAWQIPNPEDIDPLQLQHMIEQRRAEVPRDEQTSLGSVGYAVAGGAAEAAAAAARVFGNIFGLAEKVPFAGPTLAAITGTEKAKNFLYDLSQRAETASEIASMMQPQQDIGAYQFLTGAGKMAGYTLPAILAWNGLSAAGNFAPVAAWGSRVSSPFLRAAVQGGLSGAALEAGSDESFDHKVQSIGLGAILGGAMGVGGRFGLAALGGTVGAGIGGAIGSTPEERTRHAIEFGIGGAALPFVAPLAAKAFGKVTQDISTPYQERFAAAEAAQRPLLERGPQRVNARMAEEPQYPSGPDYTVEPQQPQIPIRVDQTNAEVVQLPGMQEALSAELSPTATPAALGATPEMPRLMSPERGQMTDQMLGVQDRLRTQVLTAEAMLNDVSVDPHLTHAAINRADATSNELYGYLDQLHGRPPVPPPPPQLAGTKVVGPDGLPKVVYHGTGAEYDDPRISFDPNDGEHLLFGPGYYTTEAAPIAEGYAGDIQSEYRLKSGLDPQQVADQLYLDTQRKLNNSEITGDEASFLQYHLESADLSNPSSLDAVGKYFPEYFDAIQTRQPNVRVQRLNIQNPLEIEYDYHPDEINTLIDKLAAVRPGYDWEATRAILLNRVSPEMGDSAVYGETLYFDLAHMTQTSEPAQGPRFNEYQLDANGMQVPPRPVDAGERMFLGRTALNLALKDAGYDGITHIGGGRTGSPAHRVWIAFDAAQIHSPWDVDPLEVSDAIAQGTQMSKQASIMESATLPDAVGKVKIEDTDVARAMHSSNPAGVSVLKGVSNPIAIMEELPRSAAIVGQGRVIEAGAHFVAAEQAQSQGLDLSQMQDMFVTTHGRVVSREEASALQGEPGEELHTNTLEGDLTLDKINFVQREGRLDALIGDVTPEQLNDYTNYGIFRGQSVVTATGVEGTVLNPSSGKRGLVMVQRSGGGPPLMISRSKVLPSRFGAPQREVPDLWNSFQADVLRYMNENAAEAGMAPVASMTDPRVGSLLAERTNDFLDRMGVSDPAERQVIEQSFNHRWVQEFQALDPEARELQARAVDEAAVEQNAREDSRNDIPVSLEEKAQSRGFVWLSQPGTGGTLRDLVNPEGALELPMVSDEATESFLEHVDRAVPDLTPASDVPAEVMEAVPAGMTFDPILGAEETSESISNAIGHLYSDDIVPGAGGGGGVPPEPPSDGPASPDYGGQGRIGGANETLGGQFRSFYKSDPANYHKLVYEFQGLLASKLRYTRYAMLRLETKLSDLGINLGKAWEHFDNLAVGRTRAFNEGHPWIEEWGSIMREFPHKLLRNGTVTRIHEIEDFNARMAEIYRLKDRFGISDKRINQYIAADARITDFMHRWALHLADSPNIDFDMDREIFRYMPHVRARQAAGVSDPYDIKSLNPNVQFFGEHVRDGKVQFRLMDARQLGNYMIRSAMFKKYESDAWQQLVDSWQDPRIPKPIRDYMIDYANISRYGYDGSGEVAVRGVKFLFGKLLNLPLTTAEAQKVLNMPVGGMYMSLLAGRTSIFFRDAIQPLIALGKVRAKYMTQTYADVLRGKNQESLRAMWERGKRAGWIEMDNPGMEAAGMFEEQPAMREGQLEGLTHGQETMRELAATLGDQFSRLPLFISNPHASSLNTLRWYAREQQLNRLVTGESAYRQALDYLAQYRRSILDAAMQRDPSLAMNYDDFANKSFFSSFERPIQRKLRELVEAGDDTGAAETFAREVANWSQNRYGRKEMPTALRGGFGRMMFMFSNFTGQWLEGLYSGLANGTASQRARVLMTQGAVTAALSALTAKTGWGFSKWAWGNAVKYTGGPLLERTVTGILAGIGAVNRADDRSTSPVEQEAMKSVFGSGLMPRVSDFVPYTGYLSSAGELSSAAQGDHPFEQAMRFMVTGERGSGMFEQRAMDERLRQEIQAGAHNDSVAAAFRQGEQSPNGGLMPNAQPPLRSYQDTLSYLVGGSPVVVNGDLGEGTYGTYAPIAPRLGRHQDTITVNPNPGEPSIPRDFTLAHEMGHRLYNTNEQLKSMALPLGQPAPELQALIAAMHGRSEYVNTTQSEPFAQAFAQALQTVRGQPYAAPTVTGTTNPDDVAKMEAWIRSKLQQRSNPGAGAQQ